MPAINKKNQLECGAQAIKVLGCPFSSIYDISVNKPLERSGGIEGEPLDEDFVGDLALHNLEEVAASEDALVGATPGFKVCFKGACSTLGTVIWGPLCLNGETNNFGEVVVLDLK